jgi:carbon-monoxide dehydrogenase medium subunit
MKAAPFTYHDPRTLDEAIKLLSLENAKLLAGGQSLVPMLNMRFAVPDHVIDLNHVAGLAGIKREGEMIEIGAMTRQADLEESSELSTAAPILREALGHVGHFQTRSRGTIGGSLCHLDPSAELPALMLLMDAEFTASGPSGTRRLAAAEWFKGFMQPALKESEVLTSIRFMPWLEGHRFGFCEFARRHGDYALAGAAALMTLDAAGAISRCAISVFGVEVSPRRLFDAERLLTGSPPSESAFREAASLTASLDAMDDTTASASYRRRIAAVMVQRALAAAVNHAKERAQ